MKNIFLRSCIRLCVRWLVQVGGFLALLVYSLPSISLNLDAARWKTAVMASWGVTYEDIILTWRPKEGFPQVLIHQVQSSSGALQAEKIFLETDWDNLSHYRLGFKKVVVFGLKIDFTKPSFQHHEPKELLNSVSALGFFGAFHFPEGIKITYSRDDSVILPHLNLYTTPQGIEIVHPDPVNHQVGKVTFKRTLQSLVATFQGFPFMSHQGPLTLSGSLKANLSEDSGGGNFDIKLETVVQEQKPDEGLKPRVLEVKGWGNLDQGLIIQEFRTSEGLKGHGGMGASALWVEFPEGVPINFSTAAFWLGCFSKVGKAWVDKGQILGCLVPSEPLHLKYGAHQNLQIQGRGRVKDIHVAETQAEGSFEAKGSKVEIKLHHKGWLGEGDSCSTMLFPSDSQGWAFQGGYSSTSGAINNALPYARLRCGPKGYTASYKIWCSDETVRSQIKCYAPTLHVERTDTSWCLSDTSVVMEGEGATLTWEGRSLLAGRPLKVQGELRGARGSLNLQLEGALLEAFGVDGGKIDVKSEFERDSKKVSLDITLDKARMNWPVVGWVHTPGKRGVGLKGDIVGEASGTRIHLEGWGDIPFREGEAVVEADGRLSYAAIKIAKMPSQKPAELIFLRASEKEYILEFTGPEINVGPLVKSLDFNRPLKLFDPLCQLTLKFNNVACGLVTVPGWNSRVKGTITLLQEPDDIRIKAAALRQTLHTIRPGSDDLSPVKGELTLDYQIKKEAFKEITLGAVNLGQVLKVWDISEAFDAGEMKLTLRRGPQEKAFTGSGSLRSIICHYHLGPLRYILYLVPPFTTLVDSVAVKGGLIFDTVNFDIALNAQTLTILKLQGATGQGLGLGISLRGQVDFECKRLFFLGMASPSHLLGNLISRVPLLGPIFSGTDGGYFMATRFSVQGPWSLPDVQVNPLSIFWPLGMLNEGLDNMALAERNL